MREYLGVCRGRLGEDGYRDVSGGRHAVCYKLTAGETCPTCRDLPPVSPVPFLVHPVCFLETAHHWKQAGTPAHPDMQGMVWDRNSLEAGGDACALGQAGCGMETETPWKPRPLTPSPEGAGEFEE